MRVVHSALAQEAADLGGCENWLPQWEQHPSVLAAMGKGWDKSHIRPVSLYYDGVKFTQRDSFLGFYVRGLLSKKVYLSFLIRPRLSFDAFLDVVGMSAANASPKMCMSA
eukprot:13319194-Alexandrium_andersonii.AAC.1